MDHKLVLNVPEYVCEALANSAESSGETPEQITVERLADAAHNPSSP